MVRMGGMKYGSLEVAAEAGGQVAGPRLEAISRRVRYNDSATIPLH